MQRKRVLMAAAAAGLLTSGVTLAALYGFGPAETWTSQEIARETATVSDHIAAFGAAFGAQLQTTFEQIISAVAVATKQEALSASVVSDNARQSAEQLVNAVRAQRESDQIAKAMLDFNPVTGQGFDPCGVSAKTKTLDLAFEHASAQAKSAVAGTDVAPGRLVASTAAAMQQRLALHRGKFCTPAEAAAGLCALSALPGGDANAALLFEAAPPDSLASQARAAYIQHVLGPPDQAVPRTAGGTPAGEAYLMAKNRKDALLSAPAYSLAMIDAANTQSAQWANESPNQVLKRRVNQYFGGPDAEAWAGALARQSQRGLLVEAVKMTGLEIWLHQKQYEQNQRLEANMAALLLAAGDRLAGPLARQYQQVLSETASGSLK